jgi:hypothetical protein
MADVGAPTKFKDEYVDQVYKLCLLGATDAELADFFGVQESTINNWKISQPEFLESIKRGKQSADSNVAQSLYHRATGYEHPDVDIKVIESKIVKTDLVKHYPPDTTAAIFWLKNRQKANWRDKTEQENSGEQKLIIETRKRGNTN